MKKILLLGPEVSDFLNPLAKKLKDIGYTVDLLETRKVPRHNESISESYSNILNYHEIVGKELTYTLALKYIFKIAFFKKFLRTIFINYCEGSFNVFKSLKNTLNQLHYKERFSPILNKYDIINIHSLTVGTLSFVNYLEKDKKIILSYWGSDLFQIWGFDDTPTGGLKNYYEKLGPIKRANIITVFSYEMERVVIAKFGSEIKNKIVRALFGIRDETYEMIDEVKKKSPDINFIKKYDIPENKIKVTIGYCGDPICNHLPMIDELIKIEQILKEKIHLLVPMTYGSFSSEYIEKVKLKLNETQITYTIFDKYLSLDELVKLRATSNIMLMMNKSDALSASVCESLYAGNILISAVWLPYSPFRSEKIFFYETDFTRLSETVIYAIDNFDEIKPKLVNNPDKVKNLTGFNQTSKKWINLLESL